MNKLLTLAAITMLFIIAPLSHAFNTTQRITYNDYDDTSPRISNNGDLVWILDIHYDTEIKLRNILGNYQNFPNITYLEEGQLQMSADGNVVWQAFNDATDEYEIKAETYPYNGVSHNISLSPDRKHKNPQINDFGHVVWLKQTNYSGYYVYLYDGVERHNISNGFSSDNEDPQINNNSQVVWVGNYGNAERDIVFYNYDSPDPPVNLSTGFDYYQDGEPQINNNGEVVWTGSKGINHWIFYYDGNTTVKLAEGHSPQINDLGDIVWGNDGQVWLYHDGNMENITNYLITGNRPQINNNGQVVWSGLSGFGEDIFLYDYNEDKIKNLTHFIDGQKWDPKINDDGHVVWQGKLDSEDDWEVFCYCPAILEYNPLAPLKPKFEIVSKPKMTVKQSEKLVNF